MLKIYNTLTKQKEEFVPLNPPNVNFYMCGPTVYDFFHVGNARSFLMSDVLRRYLEYKGYKVKFVMNLTDVDDKIIKKSNQENVTSDKIAEKYINYFLEDVEKLGMKKADVYPRATQHMSEIIGMIKKLEDKGIAYNVNGNVFYDVSKFNGYGKLSGKKTDDLESGSRVEINEEKKNPLDFSLWKKAKEGEPYWESPWGKGRPGWHIECSAMSCKHLGDTFDIHGGGNDLIFPHHENEIAQSEGATGKPFVKYWMHFGFLNINEEKMSKSLGNFFTARDILKKYSPFAIRMFFTQAHYGGPLNFSDELLASAEKGLEKLNNLRTKISDELKSEKTDGVNPDFNFQKFEDKFVEVMDDDFNTPQGIAVLFDFAKEVNRLIADN
ncbi:MAG: cysteine--tRNA ligase, partial [Ignavibacteriaceae bacterium]